MMVGKSSGCTAMRAMLIAMLLAAACYASPGAGTSPARPAESPSTAGTAESRPAVTRVISPGPTSGPTSVPSPTQMPIPTPSFPLPAPTGVQREGGSAPPMGMNCPPGYPVKGNFSTSGEKIYHLPGGAFYSRTRPEVCFATEDDAQAAGFRPSKR
jgi:hypothetical protein